MAAFRRPRHQVGSSAWVADERACALEITQSEIEEFSFSARNDFEWLNEHMGSIFNDENAITIAESFKTPGKLRGNASRSIRKPDASERRVPLSDVFSATPNGQKNVFAQRLSRVQSPRNQAGSVRTTPIAAKGVTKKQKAKSPPPAAAGGASQDSGFFGSQDIYSQNTRTEGASIFASQGSATDAIRESLTATQVQQHVSGATTKIAGQDATISGARTGPMVVSDEISQAKAAETQLLGTAGTEYTEQEHVEGVETSPIREASSPQNMPVQNSLDPTTGEQYDEAAASVGEASDEIRSNSDASSPIRPVVRKSSLNFASLPAREPLAAGKSMGARTSRLSHLDNRKSYYNRPMGEKSLGHPGRHDSDDEAEADEMEVEQTQTTKAADERLNPALNHNKTYTQRLQDQINMLGKSNSSGRPSKSLHNYAALQPTSMTRQSVNEPKSPPPKPFEATKTTPGAFPEDDDDDDDWIESPPRPAPATVETQSPRPVLPKSHTADVMEGIHQSARTGDDGFDLEGTQHSGQSALPVRPATAHVPQLPILGHAKSPSVSTMPAFQDIEKQTHALTKAVSVPNPSFSTLTNSQGPRTPSKSPTRSFRDSPLKQVKNKLSSILKSSKGLLASSAAISAEGKTSLLSPSASRVALHLAPSAESVIPKLSSTTMLKPGGENLATDAEDNKTLPVSKRTRASIEREKEEKRREKETKRMEGQMGKLEKAREQEREKARVFSKEQERIAALERQVAAKKEEERTQVKETPKPTRSSPRKLQRPQDSAAQVGDQDVDMSEAPSIAPPPSIPRSVGPSSAVRPKELKRPLRPVRETQAKAKQAPTLIRVNTGSQHPQYHAAASNMAPNVPEPSAAPTPQAQQPSASKASKATLQTKPSTQSLKSAASAARPKTADVASKKKEQEEKEAQRRREAKAEMDKKRAAAQEEQRKQEQRRQEAERQKQRDREQAASAAESKQSAQRQAMIEKAKQTRAPPPAVRPQPNGPPDFGALGQEKPMAPRTEAHAARPASRMDNGYDEPGRVNNVPKSSGIKRTLAPEARDDATGKRPPSRVGTSYQAKDGKRRRTSEGYNEVEDDHPPNIKGPPVRPSAGFKKELPKKPAYHNGYVNPPAGVSRDLFKATVTAQHNSHSKPNHPLDMAQISKGAIPFAPHGNASGAAAHKTPARPTVANGSKSTIKTAKKSSPRFQNGESIELPEIETDDEDESGDESKGMVASWAESPDLRRALMQQETVDPAEIFGPPVPLNMEEVFSKTKERWHKFRARTSSANWSGMDRLTEDDIRKDLAAREQLRREGGWSYELSRGME